MVYCRSCGMSMSETATLCPACGAAVAATPAAAAPDAPALIATVRLAPGWPGKTITYAAGRFTLEGSGEITPQDVLAYDAEGQLDWAYGGMRDWVVQLSTISASVRNDCHGLTAGIPRVRHDPAHRQCEGHPALGWHRCGTGCRPVVGPVRLSRPPSLRLEPRNVVHTRHCPGHHPSREAQVTPATSSGSAISDSASERKPVRPSMMARLKSLAKSSHARSETYTRGCDHAENMCISSVKG